MSKKKKFKAFKPTSERMEEAFENIIKAEKYIVITERQDEYDGKIGRMYDMIHQTDGPRDTQLELESWAEVMRDKADTSDELDAALNHNKIKRSK